MADPQSNAVAPARPANPIPADAPSAGVIHFRHRHTDRFTVVGNHLAQHAQLSAVAIGLAVYIQSVPDGVSVTAKALTLRFREGEITIRRALNELEEAGYLERRRIPLGGGRFATRTLAYDKPVCAATHSAAPVPQQPAVPRTEPEAEPTPPAPTGPAVDLLARLRTVDARLILSVRDVQRLTPAVEEWLARHATAEQITRTLTANLPPAPIPIHHPPRFLEHRLTTLLPPPLPVSVPEPQRPRPAPLITCDGCERAFRSHVPDARCGDCGPAPAQTVA
ncbi:hypothetical protein [Streptomyces nojiriensis]|uniref:hypothetical protein n=1 Tax=Streptomyces nojiriensis TaxID=66374 RepID=UPI0035DC08F5